MNFADFHFLRSEWLILLPVLLALIYLFKKQILSSGNWHSLIEPDLIPYVLSRHQLQENKYKWWLIFFTGMLVIFSLSGPTWERIEQPAFRTDQSLVIALDLSRSMNAQDMNPNRITRGKLKILDILKKRQGTQVALIVYSANAFTVTPLTTDSETIASLVGSLDTNIMPSRGSYPAAAIDKGLQLLKQASVVNGEILLITDGGSSSAALTSATNLKNEGYSLSVLGVGTMEGAPIPENDGGFITDRNGQIALARLDREGLSELAQIGDGKYINMTIDDRDIDLLLMNQTTSHSNNEELLATDQWNDIGPWFLLIVVPISSLAFRRRWIF
ncbi:MAG: VWA domain-containing protein [Woeseiaceae bacterium]|nr:VWA domain-containing protein [Woeseiaceae bacterium]MDG1016448.1 VWA domain-containing protein [Woeseiaceae bacterium]MDG1864662.1 VWA domain-containing protein [Woeseiaceae bacterium]